MFYYTYVLKSKEDKKFYTGVTTNLKRGFEEHNSGYVESTRDRKPFVLIYYESCLNKADAEHKERYLKTTLGKRFIGNRLKSYLTG
jgi:putative endonuclease